MIWNFRRFLFVAFLLCSFATKSFAADSPYALSWKIDAPLLASGALLSAWGNYRYFQMEPKSGIPSKADLLPWDRPFAGMHRPAFDDASDWTLYGLSAAVLGAGLGEWAFGGASGGETATFIVSAVEIALWQNGLNYLARSLRLWGRPEIYRAGADRSRGESWGSFYSGHVSAAFSAAVFGSLWFEETHEGSPLVPFVWGASLSLAGAVGAMRVAAGKHYPSDVAVGAVVGSALSFAVLRLHASSRFGVAVSTGYSGFYLRF